MWHFDVIIGAEIGRRMGQRCPGHGSFMWNAKYRGTRPGFAKAHVTVTTLY